MPTIHIIVPDGQDEISVTLRKCKCGCGSIFTPLTPRQKFLNENHQEQWSNDQQPRKTDRRRKPRPA